MSDADNPSPSSATPRPAAGVSAAFPAGTRRLKLHLFSFGVPGGGNSITGIASACGLSFLPDRKLFSHLPAFPIVLYSISISISASATHVLNGCEEAAAANQATTATASTLQSTAAS
uniref:Uncharacterized protein n=1 Tax=Arundo donax TaxID=35708 RepID=A0A0A9DLZ8_ARUDO